MIWTHFMDMCSGGGRKEKFDHCYIEANETMATMVFTARFGHNPNNITCECCGEDYSISEYKTLDEATQYQRSFPLSDSDQSLEEYKKSPKVCIITQEDFKCANDA